MVTVMEGCGSGDLAVEWIRETLFWEDAVGLSVNRDGYARKE